MTQIAFYVHRLLNRMWFLPAVFSAVAIITVIIAFYLARWAPEELPFTISQEAVQSVLEILATSLLTVSVFALSTLVSALSAASASTSPRAVSLIAGDRAAQTSISVFIGAFLFSILAILGLSAGIYSSAGRMLLFSVTLVVVALVIAALIRWIAQISDIGRVRHTIERVEIATADAIATLSHHPLFGCRCANGEPEGEAIHADQSGYVQHFDPVQLQRLAKDNDLFITVTARPGAYVSPARPIMMVKGHWEESLNKKLVAAFVIGDQRTFENDPRFGLVVLAEIAGRALSPGINDPGTAIDVMGTMTRLLSNWQRTDQSQEVTNDRIFVPPLQAKDVFEDAFRPIARDGASSIEVVLRLLRSLETLASVNPHLQEAALATARDAICRAEAALKAPGDLAAFASASAFARNPPAA